MRLSVYKVCAKLRGAYLALVDRDVVTGGVRNSVHLCGCLEYLLRVHEINKLLIFTTSIVEGCRRRTVVCRWIRCLYVKTEAGFEELQCEVKRPRLLWWGEAR